jgi:predicted nucleic acid-binding protein
MTHGFDTGFLVAFEVTDHPHHAAARARIRVCHSNGDDFALAPQVLAEFIHVVTDQRRGAIANSILEQIIVSAAPLIPTLNPEIIFSLATLPPALTIKIPVFP